MKWLRKMYYKLVPTYKRLDFTICSWAEADKLIKGNPEWRVADEDKDLGYPLVALEIRKRITE